jgi:hypothetical protein
MLSSRIDCFYKVFLITFDAYDVGDFGRLNMANVILEQLIVGHNFAVLIRHHIKEVDGVL